MGPITAKKILEDLKMKIDAEDDKTDQKTEKF